MPSRKFKRNRRIDSSKVQGEGSYVIIASPTFGELRELSIPVDLEKRSQEEQFDFSKQMLSLSIVEWNWVDDEGNPLALPKDDISTLENMPFQELTFLISCLDLGVGNDPNLS